MTRLYLALVALCLASCGPDRQREEAREEAREYAEALCSATTTCGCAQRFESAEGCKDEFAARFDAIIDAGLTVDQSCFDRVLESFAADPCAPLPYNGDPTCAALMGSKAEGEACSIHLETPPVLANECGELLCYEGTCIAMAGEPDVKTAGDPCDRDYFPSCHSVDLYCGADSLCHEWPSLGEPCEPFGCLPPLVCAGSGEDAVGMCAEQAQIGEPCDPLDWDPCVKPEDPDETVVCDAVDKVCTLGEPLCPKLNYPRIWH